MTPLKTCAVARCSGYMHTSIIGIESMALKLLCTLHTNTAQHVNGCMATLACLFWLRTTV